MEYFKNHLKLFKKISLNDIISYQICIAEELSYFNIGTVIIFVTIHLKLSIIYGLSIPKAPKIYLTTKLQCKPRRVYLTAYFPGRPGQAW